AQETMQRTRTSLFLLLVLTTPGFAAAQVTVPAQAAAPKWSVEKCRAYRDLWIVSAREDKDELRALSSRQLLGRAEQMNVPEQSSCGENCFSFFQPSELRSI